MLDFGALPPEINSGRMYAGPGSGPMLAAAAGWDGLAAELGTAAAGYGAVVTELTSSPWVGPASAAMMAAAAPYVAWLGATADQAEQAGMQARAAAAAYETAFAMTVPPAVIAANRALLAVLVATNFFGQNTPAIAATEAEYAEMWAQDAVAMYGYAASSATASVLNPFTEPPKTADPNGVQEQAAAIERAAAIPAGNAAAATSVPAPSLTSAIDGFLTYWGFTVDSTGQITGWPSWLVGNGGLISSLLGGGTLAVGNQGLANSTTNWPYFPIGTMNFTTAWGAGLVPGAPAPSPALGGALPPPGAIGAWGTPVAGWGQAGLVGKLSVPPTWAANTVSNVTPLPGAPASFDGANAAPHAGTSSLIQGMPTGSGRRGSTYTAKYGFKYNVLTRSPSAG
ncbi:PPE family protein [Mycobacterium asiaticum]|uniref:PPE family protein n=1 Tax=Mycobacterium asiaticum TaxID=1790 RepID=UPI0007EF7950|nr:PPE family protein [Mycobacterium asiaticum]OBJ53540.1 hypothetical protein A9W94_23080 [Mycobacterium asiaticum]